jgi:beta-lactamase superfamily II metal-dependent hydrolase
MIFSLDVRRAGKGDCLLLHCGSKTKPRLIMIDGGSRNVYRSDLRPRLLEIKQARGLSVGQPLPVDLLMVSHVDDDHIRGILDLTRDLTRTEMDEGLPPLIRVTSLWLNSFDDLIGRELKELTASMRVGFGPASLQGELPPEAAAGLGETATDVDREVAESTLRVLASIEQGHRLMQDAARLGWRLNPQFGGKLILADKKRIDLGNALQFTVVGPMISELKTKQKKHDKWLGSLKRANSGTAALAAYVDKSVPNLSSIVVFAEQGGKRVLLTGDARGDSILAGLETNGLLERSGQLHVDILKVPFHGSANNIAADFFRRVTADHYVFSGNGEYGRPEREALEMLFEARGTEPFQIHLTYPIEEIDKARKEAWNKEVARERKIARIKPRGNWSPAKHSLAALFKGRRSVKTQRVRIVDAARPHVIDLIEPLGY